MAAARPSRVSRGATYVSGTRAGRRLVVQTNRAQAAPGPRETPRKINADARTGLPACIPDLEILALWRVINEQSASAGGEDPVLNWTLPIRCASQMKLTLEDHQELPGSPRRFKNVTLRALSRFQGAYNFLLPVTSRFVRGPSLGIYVYLCNPSRM